MSTRTPRKSTRSQSREASLAASDEGPASVGIASARQANGSASKRRPRASGKAQRPEEMAEDDQAWTGSTVVHTTVEVKVEEEEDPVDLMDSIDEQEAKVALGEATTSLPVSSKPNRVRQLLIQSLERLARILPFLAPLLIASSFLLATLLVSPSEPFARKVYVDENALQPGSATVEWGWMQVDLADRAAARIAMVADGPASVRAALLTRELQAIGLTAYNQSFAFQVPSNGGSRTVSGTNTYARFPAARGDGREAFVLAASWKSAWDGTDDPDVKQVSTERASGGEGMSAYEQKRTRRSNVRGISSALVLARHLSGYRHWSKDLIFVFGDGELEGMQAWTSAYFGTEQSNLQAEQLHCGAAAIWNALAIDYPSDSFSHIVIKHEGLQGQLPNMDIINTVTRIAQKIDSIPVSMAASSENDPRWGREPLGAVGVFLQKHLWHDGEGAAKYASGLLNVVQQVGWLASGQPSGIHGLFHRYHVDAITLFLHPAPGPYGFHHIGRIVESMTRSMSNLLERLHHSQFFYLLTSPYRFIEVAKYLPVAALLSAALTITGISHWIDEGKAESLRKTALVDVVRAAIEDERSDDVGGVQTAGDIFLQYPTSAQLLSSFVSLLVDRSVERGDLLGTAKLRSTAALMQVLGRPVGAAVAAALSCHLIGAYAYYILTRASVDCAAEGLQTCKPLRLVSVISTLVALLVVWRTRRANRRLLWERIGQCQTPLPDGVIVFLAASQGFRIKAVARTLLTIALLEAGMLVLAISLVNFSLALVLGSTLCIPLCLAKLPQSTSSRSSGTAQEARRSVSPASNDTDHVENLLPSLPTTGALTSTTKISLALQSAVLLSLTPYSLIYLAKAATHFSGNEHASTMLDWAFDYALLQHHILGTLTIPVITLVYLPLVLLAFVATLLAAG